MDTYYMRFVDHGDNVYYTKYHEHDSDEAVIGVVTSRNARAIGAGFESWDDKRLVHRHRNQNAAKASGQSHKFTNNLSEIIKISTGGQSNIRSAARTAPEPPFPLHGLPRTSLQGVSCKEIRRWRPLFFYCLGLCRQ